MTSEKLLYIAIGFIGSLFIMKSIKVLRPANAYNMSGIEIIPTSIGCSSCNKGR